MSGPILGVGNTHIDNQKEYWGTDNDSSIYDDGSDFHINPRDGRATGTLILAASVDGEPHMRLASGADHTASLVAGDLWFDGTNFKGYNGAGTVALDVQAASGGGFTDDGTRVRLTTATDHVALGTVTPSLTGQGDLTIAGNFDLEGYGAIGNGAATAVANTLTINRVHSAAVPVHLRVQGAQTVDSGTSNYQSVYFGASCVINSAGVHALATQVFVDEPLITETSGSVTTACSVYINAAPTEATNNYALFVDSGDTRLDGALNIGAPTATTTAGALSMSSNLDCEGYGAIGNGRAIEFNQTLIVDRTFTATAVGSQFALFGNITGANNTSIDNVVIQPLGSVTAGSGTVVRVTSMIVNEPVITAGSNTITTAASLYIVSAPTEATNNYALFVDAGNSRFDGHVIMGGSTAPQIMNEVPSATNPGFVTNRSDAGTGVGGILNNVSLIAQSTEILTANTTTCTINGITILTGQCRIAPGSLSAPSVASSSDIDTGVDLAALSVKIVRAGAAKMTFETNVTANSDLVFDDSINMVFNTTTGTNIGTGATEKLAFYGITPVVQPSGIAVSAAGIHAALVTLGLITA